MVPDIPASVQREIKKEKLLAYEAIHSQLVGGRKKSQPTTRDDGDDDANNSHL